MFKATTFAVFVFFTIAISSSMATSAEVIDYVGSSTVGKFITEASSVYKKAEFTINTRPESGGGESRVATGKASLGGVARELSPEFVDLGLHKFLIGRDAIGAWVNKDNPVTNLSSKQLQEIFAGKITNWKEVGGDDLKINIYVVKTTSATYKVFGKFIMEDKEYAKSSQSVRPDSAILDKIAADSGGIGHLSFALGAEHDKKDGVKKISIDGKAASVDNPKYPITRPLYLVTKNEPQGAVKDFIDWSIASDGQALIKKWFVGR